MTHWPNVQEPQREPDSFNRVTPVGLRFPQKGGPSRFQSFSRPTPVDPKIHRRVTQWDSESFRRPTPVDLTFLRREIPMGLRVLQEANPGGFHSSSEGGT
ncbi:hypothetical protein SK128_015781 [Halocaridina rubra]|uniref:Uncharacterized protein n=1 Tax=Halocaridina rubra TaxID=373956 RepID=A0AAN8X0E2_HALRR